MIEFSNSPKGWLLTNLESISEIILGQSPPSSTYNENGEGLPFYQGKLEFGEIYPVPKKWCSSPKKISEKGDVLISVRAPVGPTNICPGKSCIGRGLAAIRGLGGIPPFFILYLMRAFERDIAGKGTGTTFNAITGDQLRSVEVPLPPLPEQHRIIAKIEELFTKLDAGVEALKKVKAQLKRYRQAVLKYAFEGKLTQEWREANKDKLEPASALLERIKEEGKKKAGGKFKELPPVDTSNLLALPEGWVWATAEQLTSRITDGEHITPQRSDSGILLLSARNIQDGYLSLDNVNYVPPHIYQSISKRLEIGPGDVLLSCSGSVGRSCVAPLNLKFCLVRSVAVLKPFFNMGKFLSYSIRSLFLQGQINDKKTQTAQANIFQGKIKTLIFALPSLDEQNKIVEEIETRFSMADEVEKIAGQTLKQSERLRQSILKSAFEGKLVPQDPTDEPAEKLLERIKAEEAKKESETKSRRKKSNQMELK